MTEEEVTLLSKYRLEDGAVYGARGKLEGVKMPNGYLATRVWIGKKCKRISLHRLVFLLANGYLPKTVDHINRVRDDNRPENLRAATPREQQGNRAAQGFTKRTHRYAKPRYEVNCDHQYVGVFDTEEEAAAAYAAAKKASFGQFAVAVYASGRGSPLSTVLGSGFTSGPLFACVSTLRHHWSQ